MICNYDNLTLNQIKIIAYKISECYDLMSDEPINSFFREFRIQTLDEYDRLQEFETEIVEKNKSELCEKKLEINEILDRILELVEPCIYEKFTEKSETIGKIKSLLFDL